MSPSVHISAGWLIDGEGGPVREKVTITLTLEGVSRISSEIPLEADSTDSPYPTFIDWSSCTVLPGLVDAHVHLCWSGTLDPQVRRRQLNLTSEEAWPIIQGHLKDHMRHGVTAVRDGGDPFGYGPTFKAGLQSKSERFPEIKAAGAALHRKGRYGRIIGQAVDSGRELTPAIECSSLARDQLKIVNSGLNSLTEFGRLTAPQFSVSSLKQVVAAARQRKLPVMVHANGEIPVGRAVEAGVTSIEHGFFMGQDNLARMAAKQIFWVPTCVTMEAFAEHRSGLERDVARRTLEHQLEQLKWARELGVPVALGTDAGGLGVDHGRSAAREIELLMTAGYPLTEAIRCGTRNGAQLLKSRHPGRIAPGAWTDLIAVPGPPRDLPASLLSIVGMVSPRLL